MFYKVDIPTLNPTHIPMKALSSHFRKLLILTLCVACLLLIPYTAMQYSSEVNWSFFDFLLAGILLFSTGLAYILILAVSEQFLYRIASAIALLSGLFLLWANLAVGLIGSENNPANLMYFGVLAIGLLGAALSRLQPRGLSNTLYAMTGSMGFIIIIALVTGLQYDPYSSVIEILAVNIFFMFPFSLSAILFRKVAKDQESMESEETRTVDTNAQ